MKRFLLIFVSMTLLAVAGIRAQDTSAQKARIAQLEREIAELNRQISGLSGRQEGALQALELTRSKIAARRALIAETEASINALDDSIRVREAEAERLARRRDTLSAHYATLIRSAYKNRDSRLWYMYILSSENLGQAARRFGYLRSFSRNMNEQARKIAEVSAQLEAEMVRIKELREEVNQRRDALVQGMAALRAEEAEASRMLATVEKDRAKWERSIRNKNAQIEALNREIADIVRRASSGGTAPDPVLGADFASNRGKLPWPAKGPIVEPFGYYTHPVYTNITMPFNNGITIAVSEGTAAKAVFNGTVTRVAVIPGFNQCVLVQHGQYFTLYSKLAKVNVSKGDKVETGQVLGTVDSEGRLHFELWDGRDPQNPSLWLRP